MRASDARFNASESISSLTIRSMMCVPLLSLQGEPMGVINIDTQNAFNQFRKDDLEILIAVAGQAAMSYESARLLTSFVEKQKQDSEMHIARHVQRGAASASDAEGRRGTSFSHLTILPRRWAATITTSSLLQDGKLAIAFGDVAGKGVPGVTGDVADFQRGPQHCRSRVGSQRHGQPH